MFAKKLCCALVLCMLGLLGYAQNGADSQPTDAQPADSQPADGADDAVDAGEARAEALRVVGSSGTAGVEDIHWVDLGAPQISKSELDWLNIILKTSQSYEHALAYLEQHIQEGNISAADTATIAILTRIALYPHIYEGKASPYTSDRYRAIHLLGTLAGEQSLTALDKILSIEEEVSLLVALYSVYAELAPPFNELRTAYFTKHLNWAHYVRGDDSLVLSILSAIDSIHKRTWSMTDQALFAEILAVRSSGRSRRTRQTALSLVKRIAGIDTDSEE